MDALLTEAELADLLKEPVKKIARWRWEGRGPAFLKFGKSVRYHPSDVEDYLASHRCVPSVQAFMEQHAR